MSIKRKKAVSEQQIQKTESHITSLPRDIDQNLAIALGEMVVAIGRLEEMCRLAIKRLDNQRTLDQVVKAFSGMHGTLGSLISHGRSRFPILADTCTKADKLNTERQDFIHATFAASESGHYVRFREFMGYADLANDIAQIIEITKNTNSLIEELDHKTGSLLTDSNPSKQIICTVSAPISRS